MWVLAYLTRRGRDINTLSAIHGPRCRAFLQGSYRRPQSVHLVCRPRFCVSSLPFRKGCGQAMGERGARGRHHQIGVFVLQLWTVKRVPRFRLVEQPDLAAACRLDELCYTVPCVGTLIPYPPAGSDGCNEDDPAAWGREVRDGNVTEKPDGPLYAHPLCR